MKRVGKARDAVELLCPKCARPNKSNMALKMHVKKCEGPSLALLGKSGLYFNAIRSPCLFMHSKMYFKFPI